MLYVIAISNFNELQTFFYKMFIYYVPKRIMCMFNQETYKMYYVFIFFSFFFFSFSNMLVLLLYFPNIFLLNVPLLKSKVAVKLKGET